MKLVLLHSPLVTPTSWEPVALELRARGHGVVVPDLTPCLAGGTSYYGCFADCVAGAITPEFGNPFLVVHSGAGALVPAIAARTALAGAIFVDALLPHPGRSWFETASPALRDRLRHVALDGRLPPWDRWWPKGMIAGMLPDKAMREEFAADLSDLPLAYFEERAPDAVLQTPSAYLQLSDAYTAEAGEAWARDWPVTRLALHHLASLTDPQIVTGEIARLAAGF